MVRKVGHLKFDVPSRYFIICFTNNYRERYFSIRHQKRDGKLISMILAHFSFKIVVFSCTNFHVAKIEMM